MATSSCYAVQKAITECVKLEHIDSSIKDQLRYVNSLLDRLYWFVDKLEIEKRENWISAQLIPLFDEAYNGFSEILGQGMASDKVSEVLRLLKPDVIAERINPSKQTRSSSTRITMDMVNLVAAVFIEGVGYLAGYHYLSSNHPIRKAIEKLKRLGVFLKFTAKWCIEDDKIKDLFTFAEDVAYTASYLTICCWETYDEHILGPDLESKFSALLERMNPIRPDWRKLYVSVLKASYSIVPKTPMRDLTQDRDLARKFTESIRDDMAELQRHVEVAYSDRFRRIQDGLLHLSKFHKILARRHRDIPRRELSSLLSFVEGLAKDAAIVVHSLCDVDLEKTSEVDHMLLSLLVKFNCLKADISLIQKLMLPEFQIIDYFPPFVMDFLQKEVTFVRTFIVDSLEQCKQHVQINDVLTLVLSVATEVDSFTTRYSSRCHFNLFLKFMFIKAAIQQICPFISASSTPVHPVIYPMNFLPTYFEAIDSCFTILEPSSSSNDFMRFQEYIFEILLLKGEADPKLTDTDKIKRFYHGLLLLVTFLLYPPNQYIECKKRNGLLADMGALAIEAEAAIRLSYEDSFLSKSSKSRKVSLLLRISTVAFKLIKCEGNLTEILNHTMIFEAQLLDLAENARKELVFLRAFLMDLLRNHSELDKLDDVLMHAEVVEIESDKIDASLCMEQTQILQVLPLLLSVTTNVESFVNYLYRELKEGQWAWKINLLHFQLLLKSKFTKAAIQQICPTYSASPTPAIYPLFLPNNFEAIDSHFAMLESSKISCTSGGLKMDDVFIGFHEYMLENLLLKDKAKLELTVTDNVKGFYHEFLPLVTFLVDPPFQFAECKKQNTLLTELGTIAIETQAAIGLSYEEVLDGRKDRKVGPLLQLLTVAFMPIKCERKLTDLKHKATLEAQFLGLVENSLEELIFLRAFLMDLLTKYTELEKLEDLLMHAQVVANKAALISSCSYESFMDESSTQEISLSLSDFIEEMKSVNAEVRELCFQFLDESACDMSVKDLKGLIDSLFDMLNHLLHCSDVISFVRNQIPVVQEKLKRMGDFLVYIVQHHNMHKELKDLTGCVQSAVYSKKCVVFFPVNGDSCTWFHLLYLYDVKQVLNFVEAEVKTLFFIFPKATLRSFPKTNGLGFLTCFLGKLEELLHSKLDRVIELKPQILSVKEGLLGLRSSFDHFGETYGDHEVYGPITSATEIAYVVEYVIDSCLASSHPLLFKAHCISEVVENIKLVSRDVREKLKRKKIDVNRFEKGLTNLVPSSSANTPGAAEQMVGFQDVMDKLKPRLLGGSHELDVISLYGMPGLGKTTLAKKIYNDPTVRSHFDVYAQCYVTQVYSRRELLLTILNDVLEPADRTKKEDGQLADELRRILLTKRFLILINDVWDTKAWDDLRMCFPDYRNRSRIILTTRLEEVAEYAKRNSDPHHLRLLRDDESWELLQEELFHGLSCPPELGDVGLRIAKSCGGLPLFIVLVAGVLKEKNEKLDFWKEVEESLGSHNFGSSEEGMSIIGFSYNNLPHNLRPCFLYFGGFLRGKNIPVSKLSRVWLAEGFLEKGSENAAQDYLKDLIRKNLVMDMEKRPNGKLKTCRVHDLLHQFCVQKAKQDNFLLGIQRDQCGDSTFFPENPKEYRLSIYSKRDEFSHWLPSGSSVRSLLFNASSDDSDPTAAQDISFIFYRFKFVKVLDLESINIGDTFPSEVSSLIHMRYFSARTGANSIPSSVADLWNLETLVVKALRGELKLPFSLLKMSKLKHLHVNSRASFSLHDDMCESLADAPLDNLETFSTPCLSYGEDANKILENMPNLRKLRCIFEGSLGYSRKLGGNCVLFPRLDFLSQLESLKLLSNSIPAKYPHEFNFPVQLRELTLSKFRLPWAYISTIAELPNLQILKLLLRAFEGDHWEVKELDFPELKYLKLDNLNFAQWSISDDAFPKLECLVLTRCKRLHKIPEVESLKSIQVNWCSLSVAESAQELQRIQLEDFANDDFTVTMQPPDWATRTHS